MSQEVNEHGNECQNFDRLYQSYLKPKDFNIVIFQDEKNGTKQLLGKCLLATQFSMQFMTK